MSKKRSVTSLVFFLLSLATLLIITVFSGSLVIDSFAAAESPESMIGFGIAFALVLHIIYGAIGYGISLVFGIVATAVAQGKRRILYVIVGILLPIVLFFGGILLLDYAASLVSA